MKYFLGIEVVRSKYEIFMFRQKYIHNMLKNTNNPACKLVNTPIDPNNKLWITCEDTPINKEMYQRLVKKLIYLSHTRLDVTYAVKVIS